MILDVQIRWNNVFDKVLMRLCWFWDSLLIVKFKRTWNWRYYIILMVHMQTFWETSDIFKTINWNEIMLQNIVDIWEKFLLELSEIEKIAISWCLNISFTKSIQIHGFLAHQKRIMSLLSIFVYYIMRKYKFIYFLQSQNLFFLKEFTCLLPITNTNWEEIHKWVSDHNFIGLVIMEPMRLEVIVLLTVFIHISLYFYF